MPGRPKTTAKELWKLRQKVVAMQKEITALVPKREQPIERFKRPPSDTVGKLWHQLIVVADHLESCLDNLHEMHLEKADHLEPDRWVDDIEFTEQPVPAYVGTDTQDDDEEPADPSETPTA